PAALWRTSPPVRSPAADILLEPSYRPRRAHHPQSLSFGRTVRARSTQSPDIRSGAPRNDPRRAMALDTATTQQIITAYGTTEGDTGSPEVQIALLSHRITYLTEHLKTHKHDHHTRRGLMLLVGQRKRLLQYLQGVDIERYRALTKLLGIRRLPSAAARP